MTTTPLAVEASGLVKTFGTNRAVDGVDLRVEAGTVYGVLGPNGAGKTTTISMLATLLAADAGEARVFGHDVRREAQTVRSLIGVTGQYASVDETLSATENLVIFSRLLGLSRRDARAKASELLDRFGLTEAASRPLKAFSGGMRRRLDLAASLIAQPPLIFLDEPTTGLDPRTRAQMWDTIRELVATGSTVLLTTHDMHEADQLCSEIAIVDHGRIVAQGTPGELKELVHEGRRVVISTRQPLNGHYGEVAARLSLIATVQAVQQNLTATGGSELTILCNDTANALDEALAIVRGIGASVVGVRVLEPTLEDAFLAIAGGRLQ